MTNATVRYRLARGVKLRRNPDGSAMLLIPEGIVTLNDTAGAALELVDGERSVEEMARALAERFDAPVETLEDDVAELLETFAERGFLLK